MKINVTGTHIARNFRGVKFWKSNYKVCEEQGLAVIWWML